jgi:hypothetical protein
VAHESLDEAKDDRSHLKIPPDLDPVGFPYFPRLFTPPRLCIAVHHRDRQLTIGPSTLYPTLSKKPSGLIILVLVVNALGGFTWIGSVADGARLPVLVLAEPLLEVECMVDAGKAKFNIVALVR